MKTYIGEQTPWGVASEFCRAGDGRWVCATHSVLSFKDCAAMAAHFDDAAHESPCRLAWRCWMDGEIHGFRR